MLFSLKSLLESINSVSCEINGKWVPARPMRDCLRYRIKYAWMVLTGKADAVIWPEGQ
jgi:hypothetical protein